MKRHGISTRVALLVLALVVACGATIGGTFAWFTDEDVAGLNIIEAGNLDVELLDMADNQLAQDAKLFITDVNGKEFLWEPGCMTYNEFKVANVGNLDFQYKLAINYVGENAVEGHKLSDILQVAFVEPLSATETEANRANVLAAFNAAKEVGYIDNYYTVKELLAAKDEAVEEDGIDEYGVIIYWEPSTAEVDNQYNVNNGKTTSDGKPLHIEMGIKVSATQAVSESDMFDNTYDAGADLYEDLPYAEVVSLVEEIEGEGTVHGATFIATEELDEVTGEIISDVNPEYLKWAADFVISADKEVPAGAIALAGQYDQWSTEWVIIRDGMFGLTMPTLNPNESIGVMEYAINAMGDAGPGNYISYEEVAAGVKEFKCGIIVDNPEMMADGATTFSVQLKMYPVENIDGHNVKVAGHPGYPIGGTYTYTYEAE